MEFTRQCICFPLPFWLICWFRKGMRVLAVLTSKSSQTGKLLKVVAQHFYFFFFFLKGSSYKAMRQPSPLGLCTCVCWKSCLTWKPIPPPAPKVQPIALGGQIFSVLSDRIFNSIFFISEPSHVPTCLSYLSSNCLNIVSDGDVSIWICREEWCCGGMFNWLPAEQQWCVGFFL